MSNMDRITPLENIGHIVAENLKRLREERKLSLDAVAKCSGVSKSMLGQIERGVTNPTISTLWKIANGLKDFIYFAHDAPGNGRRSRPAFRP